MYNVVERLSGFDSFHLSFFQVSRKVHFSQRSIYDVRHFVKLLDLDSVRATVAEITTTGLN